METLTTMVTGCEHFVTAAIVGIQGDVRTQCEKTVSDLEVKLAKRDRQIEVINDRSPILSTDSWPERRRLTG